MFKYLILNYYNSSYLRSKNSTFYSGGGYSLLCRRELLEKLGGIMNENNDSKSGNDGDLNIRTKRLGINQVDTSSFGVVFYKFASHLNSNRTNLIKKTKLTRQPPPLPLTNYPNDENWGMKMKIFKHVIRQNNKKYKSYWKKIFI